jgi:integrase/recombinase XerD
MFLFKRNNGVYYLNFLDSKGKRQTLTTGCKLKSDALKFLKNFQEEIKKKSDIDKRDLNLSDVRKNLFGYYVHNISKETLRCYRVTFEALIRIIGDKRINEIYPGDIENFKTAMIKEGLSYYSINSYLRNVKAMFNKLVEFELLEFNRIAGVKFLKVIKKDFAFTTDEINQLLSAISDVKLKQIVRLTLLTASRIGEVLNIKIGDIDFNNRVINIYQKKSNKTKTIPINQNIGDLLNEILKSDSNIHELREKNEYLFYNHYRDIRTLPLRTDVISKQFKRIIKKLGIKGKFHSLRHSAITQMINEGNPLSTVMKVAGHCNITTTMNYVKTGNNEILKAVNSLNY